MNRDLALVLTGGGARAAYQVGVLRFLADLVHDNVPEARQFDPKGLVANFSQSIVKEIDFTREAFNILKFQENFRDV